MTNRSPTLSEVIRALVDNRLADLHVALPGRVQSYDAATQKADVQPDIKPRLPTLEGYEVLDLPVITDVPVAWPQGGGFFASFPLAAGDPVLLVVAERSLERWLTNGRRDDVGDVRMHALTDAVAIPGVRPFSAPLAGAHAANAVIGKDGGAQIHVKPSGEIDIGSENASDFVALANRVLQALQDLQTHFTALESIITGAPINEPGNGSPSALQAALALSIAAKPYPAPASVAAAKVKAD